MRPRQRRSSRHSTRALPARADETPRPLDYAVRPSARPSSKRSVRYDAGIECWARIAANIAKLPELLRKRRTLLTVRARWLPATLSVHRRNRSVTPGVDDSSRDCDRHGGKFRERDYASQNGSDLCGRASLGSTSAGLAQGTGRGGGGGAGTPGIGVAPGIGSVGGAGTPGIGVAPGIGTGGGAGTPGIGTGTAPGIGTGRGAGTPGVGTGGSTNPSDTLPGMPSGNQSGDQSGDQSGNKSGDKSGNKLGTAPRHVPTLGETTDADIKSEYLEAIPYKPCPAGTWDSRYGQQACLGLPYGRYARAE